MAAEAASAEPRSCFAQTADAHFRLAARDHKLNAGDLIVAAGIIVFPKSQPGGLSPSPSGIQNFWEWWCEGLHNFLENIIGTRSGEKGFWFYATIFIFSLFVNWFGLIPGIGTVVGVITIGRGFCGRSASSAWRVMRT